MIRFGDAAILAYTKLRTHRIRTGIAIAVAGLLFGLIAAVIMVAQGVFDSVDRFSDEGLNNRTVLSITHIAQGVEFSEYDYMNDNEFVLEVETAHKALVLKKQAAAKKFDITYAPEIEDPSPVVTDAATKQKVIAESGIEAEAVQQAAGARRVAAHVPFDINTYIKPYSTAKVLGLNTTAQPTEGALVYMNNGKETLKQSGARRQQMYTQDNGAPTLSVVEASLTKPFIIDKDFDNSKGEIPAIFPYSTAEKLLGYKPLSSKTPTSEKLTRLGEVRSKISDVVVSYCYRNQASASVLSQAITQQAEIARNVSNKEYTKPSLLYAVPKEADCGTVIVTSDTRTAAEKKQEKNRASYEKEIGTYAGDPVQQKIVVRGIGVASDIATASGGSVGGIVQGLLGSWLSYNSLVIPEDMFNNVPAQYRPAVVFDTGPKKISNYSYFPFETYLVEFTDKAQARALMEKTGSTIGGMPTGDVNVTPYGSGVLIVDELRRAFEQVLIWVFLVVGTVAIIILGSMIGRTVAEGRRESAVFRAIGAKRSDIGAIYGMYALLLSLRAVLFAAVLALVLALTVEILFWHEATLGARLAYAASDTTREFHLFSLNSPYLLAIVGVIVAAGLIASIIPILLGARRSPIKDMRDDT